MKTYISVSYFYLDPDVDNPCESVTHKDLVIRLNEHFPRWEGFHKAYPNMSLGLNVAMNLGIDDLHVKGPTKFKREQSVDFSIFLPTWVRDLNSANFKDIETYISLLVKGLELCLDKYDVDPSELADLHTELLFDLVSEADTTLS